MFLDILNPSFQMKQNEQNIPLQQGSCTTVTALTTM